MIYKDELAPESQQNSADSANIRQSFPVTAQNSILLNLASNQSYFRAMTWQISTLKSERQTYTTDANHTEDIE